MALPKIQLPQTPDNEWIDKQYDFTGTWMPAVDAALIGPTNYARLENLRFNDKSIEGVNGYTKVNWTTAISTYTDIRNGTQLRSDRTVKSYVLVHAANPSGDQGRVYQNTTAIGSEGDFDITTALDAGKKTDTTNRGNAYFTDASTGLVGRFSASPQNSICYCNTEETMIYSGREHRLAAAFMAYDNAGTGAIDVTDNLNSSLTTSTALIANNLVPNGDMEDDSNWTSVGTPTTQEQSTTEVRPGSTYSRKFVVDAANEGIISDTFTLDGSSTYRVSLWVHVTSATVVTTTLLDGDGSGLDDTEHTGLTAGAWNHVTFTVTSAASGSSATLTIDSGSDAAATYYIDDVVIVEDGYYPKMHLMTTRPVQGFKTYIQTANTVAADMVVEDWTGAAFASCTNIADSDTEASAGKPLGQTGSITFDHTVSTSEFRHFEELYLYAYSIAIESTTAGQNAQAEIYFITGNPGFQAVQNVWDGVYRQPIQFQVFDVDHYEDFTLHVNESSDVNSPVGGILDGLVPATDHVIMMFEQQMSAVRLTMLGDLLNAAATTITINYWDGIQWQATSGMIDGTLDSTETKTLTQTGLVQWQIPSDEKQITLFNSVGYAYKITFTGANLTGTKGGTEEVLVDLVVGVPALVDESVEPFTFSSLFKNRLMLGAFTSGAEGNRMDFSVSNAPDVFNGTESSMDGQLSLYFGGVEDITCATQLYNRFGAGIFSMLLVLKDTEVYLLTGDGPTDFEIFPVSQTVGCPAPLTLSVAEIGMDIGNNMARNVAIWLSNAGPVMFDGAILAHIPGVENYFDPNETEYINWDSVARARGWVDQTYKEYNLLIPSGSGQTDCNIWLVFDLRRRKWFQKKVGTAEFPQAAWRTMNVTSGEQKVYGGTDDGTMIIMEDGTSFGERISGATLGSAITQTLRTGDFFPSENIWDECLIRKFKVISKRVTATDNEHNLEIRYFKDTAQNSGSGVIFQDSNAANGVNVDFVDMDVDADGTNETEWVGAASALLNLSLDVGVDRTVRLIQDLNRTGWAHAFEFEVSTTDVQKGWQPIVWGIRFRVERKDDTDNT